MRDRARDFAIAAHGDQKYGDRPYSHHLDAVAEIVKGYGDHAVMVAYLHDVIEDTAVNVDEILWLFGYHVAECVALLTDEPGANRKERKKKTYAKLSQSGSELALIVKAADRLANVRACVADGNKKLFEMYKKEHADFRAAVYRPVICDQIWAELDSLFVD